MEIWWFFPLLASVFSVIALVILIFPLPVSLRVKVIGFFYRLIYPSFIIILILLAVFFQEFTEQRKFSQKRKDAFGDSMYFFAAEQFKHQRNMYMTLLALVLIFIVCTLSRVLNSFVKENKKLRDQLDSRSNSVQSSGVTSPRASTDEVEHRHH